MDTKPGWLQRWIDGVDEDPVQPRQPDLAHQQIPAEGTE